MNQSDRFEVRLPLFEGPFDLLLFFIRRDELDIHDIPIATITNDFLDYIAQMERLNIEVASEFILVASTLMSIKARMLLPRVEKDEEGNDIDPRADLVRHLLEYKKYKSVVEVFEGWETAALERHKRGNLTEEVQSLSALSSVETELQDVTLYKLLRVYMGAMKRFALEQQRPVHQIVPYTYSIEEQKEQLMARLRRSGTLSFEEVMRAEWDRVAIIFNFLAILELMQAGAISLRMGIGYNNFWIGLPGTFAPAETVE